MGILVKSPFVSFMFSCKTSWLSSVLTGLTDCIVLSCIISVVPLFTLWVSNHQTMVIGIKLFTKLLSNGYQLIIPLSFVLC